MYELREETPSVETFRRLRAAAGMTERSREAAERGLPNSQFAVVVVHRADESGTKGDEPGTGGAEFEFEPESESVNESESVDESGSEADDSEPADDESGPETHESVVGMARVVGDGGTVYHVCDMAVHPDHQRRGLGSRLMDAVMDWLDETAPPTAYVNLMADVEGFYERWGFEPTAPASRGMYYRVGEE